MPTNKCRFTLKEKQNIVLEAIHPSSSIKGTSRKYQVCSNNIRRWRKSLSALKGRVGQQRYDEILDSGAVAVQHFERCDKYEQSDKTLMQYIDEKRNSGIPVSICQLGIQYKKDFLDKRENKEITSEALRKRMYRFCKRRKISNRRATHQSQNTRHYDYIITDFVEYI